MLELGVMCRFYPVSSSEIHGFPPVPFAFQVLSPCRGLDSASGHVEFAGATRFQMHLLSCEEKYPIGGVKLWLVGHGVPVVDLEKDSIFSSNLSWPGP